MIDVIIPALNEELTIGNVVQSCHRAASVSRVIVVVDAETTDDTADAANKAGAIVYRPVIHGKGELIKYGLGAVTRERVLLCDADYTRIPSHVVELAAGAEYTAFQSMRIVVPKEPTYMEWVAEGIPDIPFHRNAWAMNSGLRSFPTDMAADLDLHGYLTETQLNQEAARRGVRLEIIHSMSFRMPLRFSEYRLQAMEADRTWGLANGVLDA